LTLGGGARIEAVNSLDDLKLDEACLAAGGTLTIRPISGQWRIWLAIELVLVYVGAPLAMIFAVRGEGIPLFLALLPVLVLVLLVLLADPTFSLRREMSRGFDWATLLSIILVAGIAGGAIAAYISDTHPRWFLELPRNRPETWSRIMLLYPLASVAAQELVYRTFYFHRYGPLFGEQRWVAVMLNGLLFGFGHIVIGTWFAVTATCFSGLLFAVRYATTRSFWAVFLEHTLWGWFVFTVGLGQFFFTGVANIR